MRNFIVGTLGGLAALGVLGTASADVIVRLDSGNEVRGARAWKDGDVVRVAFRTGVVSFPAASVVSIEETSTLPPAPRAGNAPPPPHAPQGIAPVQRATGPRPANGATASDAAASASGGGGSTVDETIPNVAGEDSKTKLDRLDALSMQTHRQLSIARTQGQSQETLDALQRKIDTINDQRLQMMKKLGQR